MRKALACLLAALLALCAPLCAMAWELSAGTQNFIANPIKGAVLTSLTVEYTITWSDASDMSGWNTLLAFSNAGYGARVSFQSAPFVSFRDGGASLDIGLPGHAGEGYASPVTSCQAGTAYTFQWTISESGASVTLDGSPVGALYQAGSATCRDILAAAAQADYFFVGVGRGKHSSDWVTESCTLTGVRVNGQLIRF